MKNSDKDNIEIKSLADLFKGYKGEYLPEEWDTGGPVGNEIDTKEKEKTEMYIDQIRELNKTHKKEVFDFYMTFSDIIGLAASLSAGCRGNLPDIMADAEHLRDVVTKLNKICTEAGKPPLCLEFENATPAQIVTSVIGHSRRIKLSSDLSWLDEFPQ